MTDATPTPEHDAPTADAITTELVRLTLGAPGPARPELVEPLLVRLMRAMVADTVALVRRVEPAIERAVAAQAGQVTRFARSLEAAGLLDTPTDRRRTP